MGSPSEFENSKASSDLLKSVPPFVGRVEHLDELKYCLGEAIAGRPRVVLIEGDAGIGKTRLVKEVWSHAMRSGVQICSGRGYEDLTLPYLPFVEMLRYPMEQPPEETQRALNSDTEIICRFLNLIESASPVAQTSLSTQAAHDKLRLFVAVSRTTIKLAQRCPILLVLDDLQWADRSSLDLFGHLVYSLTDTVAREPVPMLILGTHRPVAQEAPLARLIARLQSGDVCQSLTLPGLKESEIQQLIQGLGLERPSHQLIVTVSEATSGNPLFIQEVIHYLVKQNALEERGGYVMTTSSSADLPLPDQIAYAIKDRMQELSESCRKVITLAAFIGDSFSLPALGAVSGLNEEELLDLLEEGIDQHMILSENQEFRFSHALYRNVCYKETSSVRRQRIHKKIAQALEHLHADNLDGQILKIAHHLIRAGSFSEAEKTIQYACQAGDQAFAIFAWGEAAQYYSAALSFAENTEILTGQDRASLNYKAGLAYQRDMDAGPCLDYYEKAIEAYKKIGDMRGLARVLMEKTHVQISIAAIAYGKLADVTPLEAALEDLDENDMLLQGNMSSMIALAYWHARQPEKAKEMAHRALETGKHLKNDLLCAHAHFSLGLAEWTQLHVREALKSWQNSLADARRAGDMWFQNRPLTRMPLHLARLGRLDEAESVALEGCALTRDTHDWANYPMALTGLVTVAVARGDFRAAERYTHEAMMMVSRSRYPWGGMFSLPALASARALRGAWAEAEDALDILVAPGCVFDEPGALLQANTRVYRQLVRAYAGSLEKLDEQAVSDLTDISTVDPTVIAPLCALVELGDFMNKPIVVEHAYPILSLAAERGMLFSSGGWIFLLPRILGIADTLGGLWDKAETHFRSAIDSAKNTGARPELGRSYLDYARMLLARDTAGDRQRAIELLSQAFPIFNDLGMEPFVRQADQLAETLFMQVPSIPQKQSTYPDNLNAEEVGILLHLAHGRTDEEIADHLTMRPQTVVRHVNSVFDKIGASGWKEAALYAVEKGLISQISPRNRLRITAERHDHDDGKISAQKPSVPEDRPLRVVLVTDMEGSTDVLQRLGDEKASELHHTHNRVIRGCLREHHGSEVTHTGDGIEASFTSASTAIECAVAMQRAFNRHNQAHLDTPIRLRIGLTAGEPIPMGDRLFGTAVYTAFRICDISRPGQILVSDVVQQLAAGKDISFIDRGYFELKGFSGEFQLYEVPWESELI